MQVDISYNKLSNIAKAIRSKNSETDLYYLSSIPDKIRGLIKGSFEAGAYTDYPSATQMLRSWDSLITSEILETDSDNWLDRGSKFYDNNVQYLYPLFSLLVIDDQITGINGSVFADKFKNLKKVILPKGLTYIGMRAFYNCLSLEEINLKDTSITYLSDDVLSADTTNKISSLELPSSLTGIGDIVLSSEYITDITIPNTVTKIGSMAFLGCTNLTTIHYSGTATGAPWGASNATVVP